MKLIYKDFNKENWFLVSWTLSNKCNYQCSYCPAHLHSGSTGQPKWDDVSNFVKDLKIPEKEICFRLSGGEPTYWKHFVNLAKLVKSQGHIFSFLTNGSRSVDYYKEIGKYTDGMMISYHSEYSDASHFADIVKAIDCVVVINLMMMPGQFGELLKVAKTIFNASDNVMIWPKVILDKSAAQGHITNELYSYSDEEQSILSNWPYFRKLDDYNLHRGAMLFNDEEVTANDLILRDLNNHKGWNCWAGIDMINVDMWGTVYRADCKQGGPLGNLTEYTLPTSTHVCNTDKCACLSDIYLRKELR